MQTACQRNVVGVKGERPILGRKDVQRGIHDGITGWRLETAVRRDFIYQTHSCGVPEVGRITRVGDLRVLRILVLMMLLPEMKRMPIWVGHNKGTAQGSTGRKVKEGTGLERTRRDFNWK